MSRDRVDSWDEDEQSAVGTRQSAADKTADTQHARRQTPDATTVTDPHSALPDPSWGQMIRGAPVWIWLITVLSLGSICIMFFTIMFLMVTR
jgi:hypothetical protein